MRAYIPMLGPDLSERDQTIEATLLMVRQIDHEASWQADETKRILWPPIKTPATAFD